MSELGRKTTDALKEWEDLPPITLSRWQVRLVVQALAACYDDHYQKRPSRLLPAVAAISTDEITACIQATINDVSIQAGIITSVDMPIAVAAKILDP